MNGKTAAVILGGRGRGEALAGKVAAKALLTLNGRPLAAYVLEALRASAFIGARIYVGPTTEEVAALATRTAPQGETVTGSLRNGLQVALEENPERIMVVTADLPWLTPEAVDDLLKHAPEAALVYTIISNEVARKQFPGQKRTYVRLAEGYFTGGNIFLLEPAEIPRLVPLVDRFYRARKNPLALAGLFGLGTLLKLIRGRLGIADAEALASRLIGAPARVYITAHAGIGADVDKPSHLPQSG